MSLKTDFVDGDVLYAGTTSDTDKLNGITNTINSGSGILGEIRQFALSITGAITKTSLQSYGWAICDGTTPESQGITNATITTTPDLREKFLRMSNNETTGGTGGSATSPHKHKWLNGRQYGNRYDNVGSHLNADYRSKSGDGGVISVDGYGLNSVNYTSTDSVDIIPPYYEIVYFIKVK